MDDFHIEYETKPLSEGDEDLIEEKIGTYADSVAPAEPHTKEERLVFKAENAEGTVIGGCIVNIHAWGRAVLGLLWVDERYRGLGLGSMLIREAERAAREKDCYYLCLGTLDFQARPFYEKHGYAVFSTTEDFPRGHRGWSLAKRLDRETPDYIPTNNDAESRFVIRLGIREDAGILFDGLDRYCDAFTPDLHGEIELGRKLVGHEGNLIAGVAACVGCWDECDIDGLWVEEPFRNRGLGSRLLRDAEREAKEKGAYLVLTYACDWNVGFFLKNGYTVRGELEDYPKGHRAYELEKRL